MLKDILLASRKCTVEWKGQRSLLLSIMCEALPSNLAFSRGGLVVKNLGWEDSPEEGVATHSSILAWRIPGTEELGELQSMGSQRVRHD